jgi:hypothetical protein
MPDHDFDDRTTPEDCARGAVFGRPLGIERNRRFGEPIPLADPADEDDLRPATGIFDGVVWTVAIVCAAFGLVWLSAHLEILATMVSAR